ncbi:DUF4148 domain-containing protein [Caballeronia mineralivorans]|jgi:hypothetical protein|uniref:DUF4148 domain-containing protein n=1 Tax=Caballeronia mineralivorans TaxID=2010198 RepID=UPI002B09A45D|nr:hypothetical protein [Caballeronia mineralivorans]
MKLAQSLIVAAALAIPRVSSFAQSNERVTHAQMKAEPVQLEKAGYRPDTQLVAGFFGAGICLQTATGKGFRR